ncbi:MAG: AAA family ATPase [Microcoleaceae cyanobacterium]
MTFTASSNLPDIPGYSIIEQLYKGSRTAVYRALEDHQQHSVIIKVLQRKYPNFSELVQFHNQYTITKHLVTSGIVHPLGLEPWGNSVALVMEDVGGISLQQYIKHQPLNWLEILEITQQLAEILHDLIECHVVHKDIKPANILICPQSKQIKLIDFSIASLLPKETQELKNPNVLEGTLAYLAPEQTGRMNRGIDYRTDFYGLGITLYELLTGELPFLSHDPLELIHCHIAKLPTPAHQINPDIPPMVSAIVLKLMAKNAEDRYQSALGLKYDVELCLREGKQTGTVTEFELAQRDISDRFVIPEKLYGRASEVQTLLDAFERIASQKPASPLARGTGLGSLRSGAEMMLVAGFSGIGKTAVVNVVHKPIVRQKGYFIKGKFDQFNRNIPFSAFVQALRDLMGQLLSESDAQLQQWKSKIIHAVGIQGQVIIDVVPELEQIIGTQPPVAELPASAAQNRFNLLFGKFIQVFTTADHPLVIFLDDLQWADSASLNLIKLLMTESSNSYLLMIGAYRDNEVFPAHPLMLILDEMGKANATINTITLAPLSPGNINRLVADTLNCDRDAAQPLTELVYQKTKGNPFFTTQFLLGLYGDHLIKFDRTVGHWECDIALVRQRALTDDVVTFMAQQIQKLSGETQEVLKLAACIGNQFDLSTLAIVCEKSEEDTADGLWRALQQGLILPQSEVYKFFQPGKINHSFSISDHSSPSYRFLHDRVQQAAYALIPEPERAYIHHTVGELLSEVAIDLDNNEKLFDILNHINMGRDYILQQAQILKVCNLNLVAGRKAKKSTAYQAGISYLSTGIELLPSKSWEIDYTLTFSLYQECLECYYLAGEFEKAEELVKITLKNAASVLDKASINVIRLIHYQNNAAYEKAIQTALENLNMLGLELPEKPSQSEINSVYLEVEELIGNRDIQSFAMLPEMQSEKQQVMLQLLINLIPPTYITNTNLMVLVILHMTGLSIKHGNTPLSGFVYLWYGTVLCSMFEKYDEGDGFGELGLSINEKSDVFALRGKIYMTFGSFISHWKRPLKVGLKWIERSFQPAMEAGELSWCFHGSLFNFWNKFMLSETLEVLSKEQKKLFDFAYNIELPAALAIATQRQVILNLQGLTDDPLNLSDENFDETSALQVFSDYNYFYGYSTYYFAKAFIHFCYGYYSEAYQFGLEAEKTHDSLYSQFQLVMHDFYQAISLTQLFYDKTNINYQNNILGKINNYAKKFQLLAQTCPENYSILSLLLEAEVSRINSKFGQAFEYYELAITEAKTRGYLHIEALTNELAAKFYLNWGLDSAQPNAKDSAQPNGKEKVAAGYMTEAYYCYARWGAKAKTDDLESRYPNLLHSILKSAGQTLNPLETLSSLTSFNIFTHHSITTSQTSISNVNNTLDLTTVLKASQALSGIIELDQLLCQLTQIILQNSGGDRCALMLAEGNGEWFVRAIATLDNTELCSQPLDNSSDVPLKLIQYVKHTQEAVIIDDLNTDLPVIDEYLLTQQPKSVLCLPILNQGNLIAILYLKNLSTRNAFTTERIVILDFLCTQAAISLENARLYQQSQAYAQKLEQSQLQIVQYEKMASLGNLMAGVAHEINNPLGFLNGSIANVQENLQDMIEHLELYQNHYPDAVEPIQENAEEIDLDFLCEDTPQMLDSMKSATERIKNISISLRTFSRADTEHKVSANIHEGLDSTLLILKYRLKASENRPAIEVVKDYGELSEVECFPGQLNQVFMNIIANAIDVFDETAQDLSYSELEEKPQIITIKTALLTAENIVEILIGDNGKGMTPEVKQRIFDHLFTTKGVGKGTGLGLAIARQIIVDKHGGSLDVKSAVGQGTQFCIELPMG